MYVCAANAFPGALRKQKRVSDLLEIILQTVMSYCVGSENQPVSPKEQPVPLPTEQFFPS